MKIDDFTRADCNLFWRPPLDFSKVQQIIEERLIEAWQRGNSASGTLDALVSSREVMGALTSQLSEHLDYQRGVELATAETQREKAVAQVNAQYQAQITQTAQQYETQIRTAEADAQAAQEALRLKQEAYSAAQVSLEEMRGRVKSELAQLGGAEGYQKLLQINQAVLGEDAAPAEAVNLEELIGEERSAGATLEDKTQISPPPQPYLSGAGEGPHDAIPETYLEQKRKTQGAPQPSPRKKGGLWRKVWKALNYELWP